MYRPNSNFPSFLSPPPGIVLFFRYVELMKAAQSPLTGTGPRNKTCLIDQLQKVLGRGRRWEREEVTAGRVGWSGEGLLTGIQGRGGSVPVSRMTAPGRRGPCIMSLPAPKIRLFVLWACESAGARAFFLKPRVPQQWTEMGYNALKCFYFILSSSPHK